MAGHSKFKNIMHRKGAQDAKRAKVFARVSREIMIAAKGGPNPEQNTRLRAALSLARSNNMPKDKIQNAIDKATGAAKDENFFEITYEGYGPEGVAVIVEVITTNKNKSASEVRSVFNKLGGNLGESGSVRFLFEHIGYIIYPKNKVTEDQILEIDADIKDIEAEGDYIRITTDVENFAAVRDICLDKFGDAEGHGLAYEPLNTVSVKNEALDKMINALEELEDVQEVFTNLED